MNDHPDVIFCCFSNADKARYDALLKEDTTKDNAQ
jgi:hypothetical protein